MLACHLLAIQLRGRSVETVEGLAEQADFAPVLSAFVEEDGGQCGFCTPGFAVAAYAALKRGAATSEAEVRWELVGHVCRCNAYDRIVAAVRSAAERWQVARRA